MSLLFVDTDVDVVKLTLTKRDNSGTATYYLGRHYYAANGLYSGSSTIYPLLAAPPRAQRGVGIHAGIKFDVTIPVYAKTDFTERGTSFADLLNLYELHNSTIEIRYYPTTRDGTTTHLDASNIRQVLKVIDLEYDEGEGIMNILCRDVWFKNKEVSRKLQTEDFPELDPRWDGEYGPIVFGQSTTSGEGVMIDSPFVDATAPAADVAEGKTFAGWSFTGPGTNITNSAIDRTMVRNQFTDQVRDNFVEIDFPTFTSSSVAFPVADPSNWARDLSRYSRGVLVTPSANSGRILTSVGFNLQRNQYDRCANIISGQHLYNATNPDFLSYGDVDLSVEIWLNPDVLHNAGANTVIMAQGDTASGTLEWMLYFNTADDKFTFGISHNGTTIADSVKWGSAASTGTWYQIVVQHDATGNAVGIYVNAGAVVTAATTGVMTRRNGPFHLGRNISTDTGYDGKAYMFRYWNRLITGTDVTNLYNSGSPVFTKDVSDTVAYGMRCSCELNEPYGVREDSRGNADLTEGTTATAISQTMSYDYITAKTLSFANEKAQAFVSVYHVQTNDSGATYSIQGSPLRRIPLDLTNYVTTTYTERRAVFDPPVVLAGGGSYLVALEYTNNTTNSFFIRCGYDGTAGNNHYALDIRRSDQNWAKQTDVKLGHSLYWGYCTGGGTGFTTGTTLVTGKPYSVFRFERPVFETGAPGMDKDLDSELDFKQGMKGLKDDSSGTYTGSAGAIIENPSDIIRFTLTNSDFGLGLTSSDVDTTDLGTVRTSLGTLSIPHKAVIDSETTAQDFILEVARQSRTVFYKKRSGKLSLKYPAAINNSFTATFAEAYQRGDLVLVDVRDNDYSTVVNAFTQYYKPDTLNLSNDPAVIRRAEREKLAGKLVMDASTSTSADTFRQNVCSVSQAKYGRREMTADLKYFDSSTYAQKIQNYYVDRYSTLQRRVVFRIPRKRYYTTLDLFDNIRVSHTGIDSGGGTALLAKQHSSSSAVTAYNEGVPLVTWLGGSLEGQIYEVEEEGPWLTITAETVSQF